MLVKATDKQKEETVLQRSCRYMATQRHIEEKCRKMKKNANVSELITLKDKT